MHLLVVVIQTPLSGEAHITIFSIALVRTLTSVQSQVSLEVAFLEERLFAILNGTDKFAFTFMLVQMYLKAL
jgi:hypothetical protein